MNRTIVFDNDGTLYTVPEKFQDFVASRMEDYLAEVTGISRDKIEELRVRLKAHHNTGSTFKAFSLDYSLDINEFERRTFLGVDPSDFLEEDPHLREMLEVLEGRKLVLTNNPSSFAKGILKTLGVLDLFDLIIGEQEFGYIHKPEKYPFEYAARFCEGERFMIEDDEKNLVTAKKNGYQTVLIDPTNSKQGDYLDFRVQSIYDLREIL